jgi:CRISPR-associated protein Csm2
MGGFIMLYDNFDKWSAEEIIDSAEKLVKSFSPNTIKANQIRNFYGAVNKLKLRFSQEGDIYEIKNALVLLKPQLAYAKGRNPKTEPFTKCMEVAINKTLQASDIEKAIKNFFVFVESVVAYHKFYGDK